MVKLAVSHLYKYIGAIFLFYGSLVINWGQMVSDSGFLNIAVFMELLRKGNCARALHLAVKSVHHWADVVQSQRQEAIATMDSPSASFPQCMA